jgi:hypothetical protein
MLHPTSLFVSFRPGNNKRNMYLGNGFIEKEEAFYYNRVSEACVSLNGLICAAEVNN